MYRDYEIMHAAIKILDRRSKRMDDELCHKYEVKGEYRYPKGYAIPGGYGPGFDGKTAMEIKNYTRERIDDEIKKLDGDLLRENGRSRKQKEAIDRLIKANVNKIHNSVTKDLAHKYGIQSTFTYRDLVNDYEHTDLDDLIEDRIRKYFNIQ